MYDCHSPPIARDFTDGKLSGSRLRKPAAPKHLELRSHLVHHHTGVEGMAPLRRHRTPLLLEDRSFSYSRVLPHADKSTVSAGRPRTGSLDETRIESLSSFSRTKCLEVPPKVPAPDSN
jgi:hypothetical protein